MAPPTGGQMEVATDALRTEAGVWDDQSADLGRIGPAAVALRLTRVEAGLFQVIFSSYEEVLDQVVARAAEGTGRTADVGATLRAVADTYDQEEAANLHRFRRTY